MKQKERYEDKKRRRILFTLLDVVIIVSFGLTIYFAYMKDYTNTVLFLVVGSVPLAYFIIRGILKNKKRRRKK